MQVRRSTKTANLSRAAKGAIALPAGYIGLSAALPSTMLGMQSTVNTQGLALALEKIQHGLSAVGETVAFKPNMAVDPATILGLATLVGAGAGAGKLSEKLIPIAKKSIPIAAGGASSGVDRRAIAAALLAAGAAGSGGYLLGSRRSDS